MAPFLENHTQQRLIHGLPHTLYPSTPSALLQAERGNSDFLCVCILQCHFFATGLKTSSLSVTTIMDSLSCSMTSCLNNFIATSDDCNLTAQTISQAVNCSTAIRTYRLQSLLFGIGAAKCIKKCEIIRVQAARPWLCLTFQSPSPGNY